MYVVPTQIQIHWNLVQGTLFAADMIQKVCRHLTELRYTIAKRRVLQGTLSYCLRVAISIDAIILDGTSLPDVCYSRPSCAPFEDDIGSVILHVSAKTRSYYTCRSWSVHGERTCIT